MSKIIRFIVNNHHFSILLVLIVLFYGISSLYDTHLTQDPTVPTPKVMLELYLDGASPSEMQRNVIFPLEAELRGIADLAEIRTVVYHNYAESWLTFQYGVEIDKKSREVESLITKIKRKLPAGLDFRAKEFQVSDFISSFLLSVHSESDSKEKQYEAALDLADALEKVDGLKSIRVIKADEQISITMDLLKMQRLGINIDQVSSAMRADNAFSAGGQLEVNDRFFRFSGSESRYKTIDDITKTIVFSASGTPIPLSQIVEVEKEARTQTGISRANGQASFFVAAGTNDDINILEVKARLAERVEALQERLPETIEIRWFFDQSEGVRSIVFGLIDNFIQGIGILFLVLLFSVGFRSSLIISSILPLSFLTAIFLLGFTGYGIQQMSIAGFIIALGLIVDNAIVVTENTYILQKYENQHRMEAAISGSSSAFSPLLSSTLTTVLAFVPIFMLTSDVGLYLRSMSVTIWLTLLSSLFIAVTIVTLLLSRVGTLGGLWKIPNPPSILILLIPFRDKVYQALVRFVVKWRFLTITVFLLLLAGSLYLGSKLQVEVFPPTGEPYFTINMSLPAGMDGEQRLSIIKKLETQLEQYDEIDSLAIFSGLNLPRINVVMDFHGDIVALVKTRSGVAEELRDLVSRLKQDLHHLKTYGDLTFSLFQYKDLTYTSPFTLQLSGSDVLQLKEYAKSVHDDLTRTEGVETLYNPMKGSQTLLRLEFDAERATALAVPKSTVDRFVNMLTFGYEFDRFRDGRGKEFPLLLKIPYYTEDPLAILQEIQVPTLKGGQVPLSELVTPIWLESENHIAHIMFQPTVEIDVWMQGGYSAEQVAANIMATVTNHPPPLGVQAKIGGALEKKQQDFQGLGKNALLTASLIFAIFVLQFRSFSQPFIIFSAVPLCIVGALVGLYLSGQNMTFVAAIGITSLMGIVVNDSILLVEEGNQLLYKNPSISVKEAAIEAARKRFMPVLLTSITTVAGLLPMALGDSIFKTMSIAICGGLISSTFLILFLVPVLFSFLSPTRSTVPTEEPPDEHNR